MGDLLSFITNPNGLGVMCISEPAPSAASAETLHVIDPHEALRAALDLRLGERGVPFRPGVSSGRWLALHDWDYQPSVVVIRAAMRDVWPVLVKVRALRAIRCRTIVLMDRTQYPRAAERLIAARVACVSDTASPLDRLVDDVAEVLQRPRGHTLAPWESASVLSNRTLQVAGLYVSVQGPSTTEVGRALNIGAETVRTHLERARSHYRQRGLDVSTRSSLRVALMDDGQLVGELGWFA